MQLRLVFLLTMGCPVGAEAGLVKNALVVTHMKALVRYCPAFWGASMTSAEQATGSLGSACWLLGWPDGVMVLHVGDEAPVPSCVPDVPATVVLRTQWHASAQHQGRVRAASWLWKLGGSVSPLSLVAAVGRTLVPGQKGPSHASTSFPLQTRALAVG